MIVRDDFDRMVTVWLDETAGAGVPDYLDETLEGLARIEQRPAWMRPWRWLTMQLAMPRVVIPRAPLYLALLALLLALVLIGVAIAGSQHRLPPPYGIAANGQIAFISDGQLWTSRPDGSDSRQVTIDSSVKGLPVWSRDGTRIAFLSYASPASAAVPSLIVANAGGSNPITIVAETEGLRHVSFSPDSRLLAFSYWIVYPGQRDRIFIGPADGSTTPTQVGDPDLSAFYPAFSPDGTRLAFVSDLCQPTNCPNTGGSNGALHVMRVDGTAIEVLASGQVQPAIDVDRWARLIDWSPDGATILFTGLDLDDPATRSIYAVDPAGGAPPRRIDGGPGSSYGATWSPDGGRIAYVRGDPASGWEAVVARPDGNEARVVARDVARFGPQWSPDGTRIAVVDRSVGATGSIRIVPVDGEGPTFTLPIGGLTTGSESAVGVDSIGWQRTAE
jgi:Tol biopolymer transport system component